MLLKTDNELQPAACFVIKADRSSGGPGGMPARVTQLSRDTIVASTGPPARERERSIYVTLGSGTYVLMCAAFMAGMEGSFKVRAEGRVEKRRKEREMQGDSGSRAYL